jgi:hypothetical protein
VIDRHKPSRWLADGILSERPVRERDHAYRAMRRNSIGKVATYDARAFIPRRVQRSPQYEGCPLLIVTQPGRDR